ncbi:hypothetical protein [Trichloromonas acetexigens]|jgi:hypothetical protein|uniref:Lipoprotein n=1 Tax=Trichloromonas acetexigens TaxID=38815 RepID=A0A550JJ49_9BACT|nr:hypothetical protein [Desulfuromonas acetexigens]TRO83229.1 hypothetical protein FL622_03880 [Desulfuromonas acetexigens]
MPRWLLIGMVAALLIGCGGKSFTVPKAEYREKVQTLGVLPLMVDESSTISHPEREALIGLLHQYNSSTRDLLIDILKEGKQYFDVRAIPGNPQDIFNRLVIGQNPRGRGDEQHIGYVFNAAEITPLVEKNVVDAILVVIFNGVDRDEKRWDRTKLTFLRANYNVILASAMVLTADGQVLWEYHGKPGESFLPLQYPDFDEAHYNKTEEVKIRHISLAGLERTLAERSNSLFSRASGPLPYQNLFDQLASELNPGMINPLRNQPQ